MRSGFQLAWGGQGKYSLVTMYMNLSKFWEIGEDREAWHTVVQAVAKIQMLLLATEQQQQNIRNLRVRVYLGGDTGHTERRKSI